MRPDVSLANETGAVVTTQSSEEAPPPRSRRALLAAALGGVAGAVASALGRPGDTRGAAGDPMILGQQNFAGSSATRLSTSSSGGAFWMTQNGSGSGVRGESWNGTGGVFETHHADRHGLLAQQLGTAGTGAALKAVGGGNTGVDATTSSGSRYAVKAGNTGGGVGVYSESPGNLAVQGVSTSSVGVLGSSSSHIGVQGSAASGVGVYGTSDGYIGVQGNGGGLAGVYGQSSWQYGAGVYGRGMGDSGQGVVGVVDFNTVTAAAVYGEAPIASPLYAYAGYFVGKVHITGGLSKGGGSFRIDHPLDPANKILQHSFVESPDMLNIYNGVVQADDNGEAVVELPDWFMALNRDFRYGLTPIGEFAPLYVKSKVAKGRFTIAGAKPGQEVSWQLTGIRQDAWANANRIEIELDKPKAQRGLYLHPREHGKPNSAGVDFETHQRLRRQVKASGEK